MVAHSIRLTPYHQPSSTQRQKSVEETASIAGQAHMRLWHEKAVLQNTLSGGLVWDHLGAGPCLTYRAENEHLYLVASNSELVLAVPKSRVRPDDYLTPGDNKLAWAFRWLGAAILGLPLAGCGAYPFLLLALWLTVQAWIDQPLNQADRTRAFVVLISSAALFAAALVLSWLCLL